MLLVVVYVMNHNRHYLNFLIRGALKYFFNFKEPQVKMARWLQFFYTYMFDIEHRVGKRHGNANAMSWGPCK